jgi:hypothetical protein
MSLINDALKKAARQRAHENDVIPPMPGGGQSYRYPQSQPKKTQTMVLIVGAAVALVAVSVVITGVMMNKAPDTKTPAVTKAVPDAVASQEAPKIVVQAAPAAALQTAAPIVVHSAPPEPVQSATVAVALPQATPVARVPSPTALPKPASTPEAIVQEAPPPTAAPALAAAPVAAPVTISVHSDAVQTIVDNYHISGVRAVGAGSKALVEGHVYKLNDFVDRTLGLKLVQVEEDRLTFVDKAGNTYVKTF